MSRLTVDEIFESYVHRYSQGCVHRQSNTPFAGRPGHHYFVNGRVSNEHLAQITSRSSDAEAVLIKMNDACIVSIGNTGVATAQITVPPQDQGIEEYRWIAHTHPLEQENRYQGVARGPTTHDYAALNQLDARGWRQNESLVIVCRSARVVDVVRFESESPLFQEGRAHFVHLL
ncbi:hypothetical protein MNBD_GAMMA11-783 [hydrothermal vent metagenome]|uniref:Uncharacterized protein n=1 Tax=hydrothermal vent metagenome TaxID=652676 RepID=A0A3B0XFW0_9ZZZZ